MQENQVVEETQEQVKTYPTTPDAEQYFFENAEEEEYGIKTKKFDNGSFTKTFALRNGKIVVMHELTARDSEEAQRIAGKNESRVLTACIALSAKIDGQVYFTEDILNFKLKDYKKMTLACQALNF